MNTEDENAKEAIKGEVWYEDDKIIFVGTDKDAQKEVKDLGIAFDKEINLEDCLVLAGFKNAHTHSPMTFLRSFADDLPLLDWLQMQVFPMEAKLKREDIYPLSKLAILEYLTSGITANFDMYIYPQEHARASVDCGFRTVFCGALNDFVGSPEKMEADFLELSKIHPLITAKLGFHAEYTCSRALLEKVANIAAKYKEPVYTHNSETRGEVAGCIERTGLTPTKWLDSLHIFDYGGGCYHCVHLNDEDMDIFKEKGIYVVTNPGSNMKLASGIAPLVKYFEKGISVGIGTDGPASNNCLDFFREMFLMTGMQKIKEDDAAAMSAYDVLLSATNTGALAMGLNDCDCLALGKQADIVVLDLNRPNMQPLNNITKNIVYSGSKQNVKMTIVAGKTLYEDGIFNIDEDPKEIYAKANEIITKYR
jgi:5-methylthioadenosine/S-adenosylhomocysteine deaminase